MKLKENTIGQETLINLEQSMQYEWLETNSSGAYSSSTILNCHTRKYHGLLVSPVPNLEGRYVLLSKLETAIEVGGKTFHLSTNDYPGTYHPTGHKYIEEFQYEKTPASLYRIGDILIEKQILLEPNKSGVMIVFKVHEADKPFTLTCHPLLAYRHFHDLAHENSSLRVKSFIEKNYVKVDPYEGMPPLYFDTSLKAKYFPAPDWFYKVNYSQERFRGQDFEEDLFCPGFYERKLKKGDQFILRAGIQEPLKNLTLQLKKRVKKVDAEIENQKKSNKQLELLKTKGEQFIIRNEKGKAQSIIAGFPWFGEWGRDTMISLPGLTIARGKTSDAQTILMHYSSFIKNGLLPNQLGIENNQPTYNSVDASLWFFKALVEYYKVCKRKKAFIKDFQPAIESIFTSYVKNKVPYSKLQDDGFIYTGTPQTQLTWMDARSNGVPVTPRFGLAVELNALWYLGLKFYNEDLGLEFEGPLKRLRQDLQNLKSNFESVFWYDEGNHLYDIVNENGKDTSMRPNQLFALSITKDLISEQKGRLALETVERELLTPLGLRTLSPKNPNYKPHYLGNEAERTLAYHQGTVWPWLVGGYIEASLNYHKDKTKKVKELNTYLENLVSQVDQRPGLGFISEIYDGTSPHHPKGCPAQAWSSAEIIRSFALLEE